MRNPIRWVITIIFLVIALAYAIRASAQEITSPLVVSFEIGTEQNADIEEIEDDTYWFNIEKRYSSTMKGVDVRYRINNHLVVSGRFLSGNVYAPRTKHQSDQAGGEMQTISWYDSFRGSQSDLVVRAEGRITEHFSVHSGFVRSKFATEARNDTELRGSPTRIETFDDIVHFGLEIGASFRDEFKRVFYGADLETYPWMRRTDNYGTTHQSVDQDTSGLFRRKGEASRGWRPSASFGVQIYRGLGVELQTRFRQVHTDLNDRTDYSLEQNQTSWNRTYALRAVYGF